MRRLSVRSRIALGSTTVAALLLLVALLIVQAQVARILADADASLARNDLVSFEQDITAHPGEPVDDPGTGVLVYVRDPDGIAQVDTLPHELHEVVEHHPAEDRQFTTTDDDGRTFVVVGMTVPSPDGEWALWAARSTSASELALAGLDRILLIGGLALLAGFAAASWIIATLALKPVEAARTRERQMVSDAAHELRTPLAALRTQLELAHEDFGDADALAAQVRAAEGSVQRLSALASNLLELSRLEAATASAIRSPVTALVDEFTGSVDRARVLALPRSVAVEFDVQIHDDRAMFRIDAQAFGRLVDNLLSNALAAVSGGGTVIANLVESGSDLRLTVDDNGPGMPDEFLPIAFERFTRPDSSRTTATGGSGLGLALVQAIAVEAGGRATAVNLDPGLRVTVVLPKM